VASPEESAELNRQYTQNRNDINELYLITAETKQAVLETNTKVDNLSRRVDERFDQVNEQFNQINGQFNHVNEQFSHVNGRLDRLSELLDSPSRHRVVAPPQDALRTPQEKRLSLLEMRVNGAVERSIENQDEIDRHNRIFDAYDERFAAQDRRFDALDGQMAEVLSILRSKPA
jgi:predicted nuclease with TOPRIM domain